MSIVILKTGDVRAEVAPGVTAAIGELQEIDAGSLVLARGVFVRADLWPCVLVEAGLPDSTFQHPWVRVYTPQPYGGSHKLEQMFGQTIRAKTDVKKGVVLSSVFFLGHVRVTVMGWPGRLVIDGEANPEAPGAVSGMSLRLSWHNQGPEGGGIRLRVHATRAGHHGEEAARDVLCVVGELPFEDCAVLLVGRRKPVSGHPSYQDIALYLATDYRKLRRLLFSGKEAWG